MSYFERCLFNESTYLYSNVIGNSIYCLVFKTNSILSQLSLFDAMKFNCIPIIVANEWILPFSEFLNWKLFSIQIKQKDLSRLMEVLSQVDTEKVLANLKAAYDTHFSSIKAITLSLLNNIQSRVFPMLI